MKNITVLVMTYNHVNYISQALDSILCQKCEVDFDILIHDDCSNDGTYELLMDYKERNPDKIRIIRQSERRFLNDGFNMMLYKYVVPNIDSKYVAYCDGDDYWINENKLQIQYSFMETHPEYSLCCHCAYQLKNNNDMSSKWFINDERDLDISDFINDKPGVCVATSSIFIKSTVLCNFPNWRKQYPVEDVPMLMLSAMMGKIYRFKDVMCVYRQFSQGSWSSQNSGSKNRMIKHLKEMSESLKHFDQETDNYYHSMVVIQLNFYSFRIALLNNDYKNIFDKNNRKHFNKLEKKEKMKLWFQYKMPLLYKFFFSK